MHTEPRVALPVVGVLRTLCLLLVLTPSWARADLDAKSTAYSWQNGVFRVPLEVRDNSGVARHGWPVTTGVPLPVGVVRDVAALRLVDEQGREVPSQISELNRYYARDGSLRYVLLDFQVDVPANGQVIVRLTNDKAAAPAPDPLRVTTDDAGITVDTGALHAIVSPRNPAVLTGVSVGGKAILRAAPDAAPGLRTGETRTMEHHKGAAWNTHGWERETTDEPIYVAEAEYRGAALQDVAVETKGPLRTVLVTRGTFRSTATGRGILRELYHYTTRVTFYRGKSFVKIEHDVENNSRAQPQWMYLLREATLDYRLRLDGPVVYTAGGRPAGDGAPLVAGGPLPDTATAWLYQARPTTVKKNGRTIGEEGGFIAGIGAAGVVEKPSLTGGRGRFLDVSDRDKGVTVAMRYLWEEAPRALAASRDHLTIAVNADSPDRVAPPGERRATYDLDFGERNINDVLLYFHEGSAAQARAGDVAEAFEYPLFARAPPAWYADIGAWYYELSREPAARKPDADAHWRPDRVGTVGHGENSSYNSGGHHDSQTSGWLPYIRSGSLTELEHQLADSRWSIAHNPGWAYQDNRLAFGAGSERYAALDRELADWNRLTAFGPKDIYLWKGSVADAPPAAAGRKPPRNGGFSYLNGYKILPDIEHYALFRLFEYYNLTGDPRALDAIHGFVNWAVNFENRQMFNGKTPPLTVTDYFERDPLALYRGHYSRIYAWMQFTTLAGFQTTGSPVYDEYARWQIRRILALLVDRHGQLTRIGSGGEDIGALLQSVLGTSAVARSRTQTWMEFINVAGLNEAYKTYDDERILDGIWGQADYFAHHVLWFPKLGMLNNWTAMPNDLLTGGGEEQGRRLTPAGHDWHTLGWPLLYYYTGWSEIRERYLRAEEMREGVFVAPYFLQTGQWLAQNGAKRSTRPPEAVTDLEVKRADRSGIAIEWTSPKDDAPSGHAARYFVKISDKPIVEFAPTDDPARDGAKRQIVADAEKAALASGKQRWRRSSTFTTGDIHGETSGTRKESPDWYKVNAFWMAEHVAGEPVPGPAGKREHMTIIELRPHAWFGVPKQPGLEILKPGTYYVALCAWDEDHNLSRLSNVVSFTLR